MMNCMKNYLSTPVISCFEVSKAKKLKLFFTLFLSAFYPSDCLCLDKPNLVLVLTENKR